MMGKGETLAMVKDLYMLAAEYDVDLDFVWKPRTFAEIMKVDALSRIVDTSDFALTNKEFLRVCKLWGFPTGDVFAGAAHGFYKASRYFTLYYTPKTLVVNAMHQDWHRLGNSTGRLLLWIFPPFQLIGPAIKELLACRLDAILLLPAWTGYWTAMLDKLPIKDSRALPYHRGMFVVGSRMPSNMQRSRLRCSLLAYKVAFTRV